MPMTSLVHHDLSAHDAADRTPMPTTDPQLPPLPFAMEPAPSSPPPPPPPYTIFDQRQKWLIVTIASIAATFSGFASNMYFPALPAIATDLNVSTSLVNLSVTSYLIVQGLAPSLWGPLSDVHGRRVAYLCTLLVFFAACVGLARTPSGPGRSGYAVLILLRCLQSAGSASTIAIGAGVVGDVTTRAERGGFMGVFQAGLLVPVAAGPIVGGAVVAVASNNHVAGGWRAIFWLQAVYAAAFLVLLIVLLPETLRTLVANASVLPPSRGLRGCTARFPLCVYQKTTRVVSCDVVETPPSAPSKAIDVLGPLRILRSRFVAPVVFFLAIYYAVWQMSITAMSTLLKDRYGLSETHIGLAFIANGVGAMAGTLVTGKILDVDYRRAINTARHATTADTDADADADADPDDLPIEKARLRLIPVFSLLQCLSILVFGWTIQYPRRVHVAVPVASTFITGWAAVSTQSAITTYLVDIFPERSAAAGASLNLARCLLAAGGTGLVMPMIQGIGVGSTFTVCVAVQLLALVGPFIQYRFAGRWRRDAASKRERTAQG